MNKNEAINISKYSYISIFIDNIDDSAKMKAILDQRFIQTVINYNNNASNNIAKINTY
jgi:hypothetical protein